MSQKKARPQQAVAFTNREICDQTFWLVSSIHTSTDNKEVADCNNNFTIANSGFKKILTCRLFDNIWLYRGGVLCRSISAVAQSPLLLLRHFLLFHVRGLEPDFGKSRERFGVQQAKHIKPCKRMELTCSNG